MPSYVFQVKVTPTRCKSKRIPESREPTEVVMAPFSGKSTVVFEDVSVTKTAKRLLRIVNPSEDEIEVRQYKCLKATTNYIFIAYVYIHLIQQLIQNCLHKHCLCLHRKWPCLGRLVRI